MLSLEGSRTNESLKIAFSDEARFNRRCIRYEQAADAAGQRNLAALLRAVAKTGAGYASGHLDYLAAGDNSAINPAGQPASELAAAVNTMADEHTAMYAGMARTARDEGFEDIADWFETLAKAGRSCSRRFRQIAENTR
jgi:rubrerythrin